MSLVTRPRAPIARIVFGASVSAERRVAESEVGGTIVYVRIPGVNAWIFVVTLLMMGGLWVYLAALRGELGVAAAAAVVTAFVCARAAGPEGGVRSILHALRKAGEAG